MRKKVIRYLLLISIVMGLLLSVGATRNPQQKKEVSQRFKVIPDIPPSDLQSELEKLNKEGYYISKSNILEADGKFTIFVSESDNQLFEDEMEEAEQ